MQILDTILGIERLGIITDFDGVLSPIVPDRDAAQMTHRNRELLEALAKSLSLVAVVSGRGVADLQTRVSLPQLVYVGNHGLERWQDGKVIPFSDAYRPALEALRAALKLPAGVELEDKGATFSIHYRHAPQAAAELAKHLAELAEAQGLKFFGGKMVYEIRPPVEINKGSALAELVQSHRLEGVICMGDDTTDVDMFKRVAHLRSQGLCQGLSIGVESAETPPALRDNADVMVEGVGGIEACLAYVLSRRTS